MNDCVTFYAIVWTAVMFQPLPHYFVLEFGVSLNLLFSYMHGRKNILSKVEIENVSTQVQDGFLQGRSLQQPAL